MHHRDYITLTHFFYKNDDQRFIPMIISSSYSSAVADRTTRLHAATVGICTRGTTLAKSPPRFTATLRIGEIYTFFINTTRNSDLIFGEKQSMCCYDIPSACACVLFTTFSSAAFTVFSAVSWTSTIGPVTSTTSVSISSTSGGSRLENWLCTMSSFM